MSSPTIPDLWPDDLTTSNVRTPVAILREQAEKLGAKTNRLVLAEVRQNLNVARCFEYNFSLSAPALGHYRYHLFSVLYGLDLYPLTINHQGTEVEVNSEAEFIESLR